MTWKLAETWDVANAGLWGAKRHMLSLADDDNAVILSVLAKPGRRVEWGCYPPLPEFEDRSCEKGEILLSPDMTLDAAVEEGKRLALAAWDRWLAEQTEAANRPVELAAYKDFAKQVSSLLASPAEGGIAPEDLSPNDFPILLDYIQDLKKRHQTYLDFAVSVHDLLLAPEDREHLSGILVLADVPDMLVELRERLSKPA